MTQLQNIWILDDREKYRQERRAQATLLYLNPISKDILLDVGCGEGFFTSYTSEAGFVVGIDGSKDNLLVAKLRVKQSNVEFVCSDATALPLRTASFTKIALLEVLEHLPEEKQKKLASEADRVLRRGGVLTVSVPYKEKISYTQCVHCGKLTPLWGHLCSLDEKDMTNLLQSRYSLVASCHLPNVPIISLSGILKRLPFKLWLVLNEWLGKFRKGYWILLRYKKRLTYELLDDAHVTDI